MIVQLPEFALPSFKRGFVCQNPRDYRLLILYFPYANPDVQFVVAPGGFNCVKCGEGLDCPALSQLAARRNYSTETVASFSAVLLVFNGLYRFFL